MKSRLLLMLALMGIGTGAFAQKAKYMAELPKVPAADFYAIVLPPQILAKANADMSDIRITDAKGRPVPYLFGDNLPEKSTANFIAFKQIAAGPPPDTAARFIVENAAGSTAISQLVLKLRNMDVDRLVNLAGSDDLKNWYAIKEDILLEKTGQGAYTNGSYEQVLNFPSSNYRYFRLRVNNHRREPVAIIQAGIYSSQKVAQPGYWPLPGLKFTQKDTGKMSHVVIQLDDKYRINRLHLAVAGAKYYKRAMRVYEVNGQYRNLLADTYISSAAYSLLNFSAKTNRLELEIDNEDNPPLAVTQVKAWQLGQTLVAYLDGDSNQLLFGDSSATTPSYDLKFFADSVRSRATLQQLTPRSVKNNPLHSPTPQVVAGKSIPTWAIWAAIAVVVALLAFLTFKMTQEVGKRA